MSELNGNFLFKFPEKKNTFYIQYKIKHLITLNLCFSFFFKEEKKTKGKKRIIHTCRQVYTFSSLHQCWRKGIRLHRSWSSWMGSECYRTYLSGMWDPKSWPPLNVPVEAPQQHPVLLLCSATILCSASWLSLSLSSTSPPLLIPALGPPLRSLWALLFWSATQICRNPSFCFVFLICILGIYFPKMSQYAPS